MKEKILVTCALPYVNNVPHLGHIAGCHLPADVFYRFHKNCGDDVVLVGGADSHGTATLIGAKEVGLTPDEFVDKLTNIHREIYKKLGISYNLFSSTKTDIHKKNTLEFFEYLNNNGLIEEKPSTMLFCENEKIALADRFVVGTCPYCGYEEAYGDQCDKCGKTYEITELKNPKCKFCGEPAVFKDTKHLYLSLDKISDELDSWIESKKEIWRNSVYQEAKRWINEGLKPRAITRDIPWGVKVPLDGYEDKVFYVWFDAPIGYIGITKQWSDEKPTERNWEDWWLKPDDVHYVEFMGKDNVPYHTITFPATLMGTGENWKLVDYLKGMSYLTFNGGKFSKSEQIGIFCDQAVQEFPADYWRYWLMANAPESSDSSFTFEAFANTINKDLNDVLGNFINRVLKMTSSNFGTVVPDGGVIGDDEKALYSRLDELVADYTKYLNETEFRKALSTLREIWVEGNNYIARNEPWKVVKTDKERGAVILRTAINMIRLFAVLSAPVMPNTSEKMLALLNLPTTNLKWVNSSMSEELEILKAGHTFNAPELLFSKIAPEKVEELAVRYKEKKES